MTTVGVRGLLAGLFVASLGLTAGASQGAQAWGLEASAPAARDASPGLVDHLRAKACAITQGLSGRSERHSAEQRRRDCERRHGLAD